MVVRDQSTGWLATVHTLTTSSPSLAYSSGWFVNNMYDLILNLIFSFGLEHFFFYRVAPAEFLFRKHHHCFHKRLLTLDLIGQFSFPLFSQSGPRKFVIFTGVTFKAIKFSCFKLPLTVR